jgi:hypothetical protein
MTRTAWMYYEEPETDTTVDTQLNNPVAGSPADILIEKTQSEGYYLKVVMIDKKDRLQHIIITRELIPPCPLNNPSKDTTMDVKKNKNRLYIKIPTHDSSPGCFSSKTSLFPLSENDTNLDNQVVMEWEGRKKGDVVRFVYDENLATKIALTP